MKAIITKYHGPTSTRGSRISATAGSNRVSIDYPSELSGEDAHRAAAVALCAKMGWPGHLIGGGIEDRAGRLMGYAFCFSTVRNYANLADGYGNSGIELQDGRGGVAAIITHPNGREHIAADIREALGVSGGW